MLTQFTQTFTNQNNEFYDLTIQLHDNLPETVKETWSKKLIDFVEKKGGQIQTRHCSFNIPGRTADFLANKLEQVINKINTSFLNTEYGYEIEVTKIPRDYPIEVHNIVHHHFELLIGQVWDHSKWYNMVLERQDFELANAILQLNEISHELEELLMPDLPPHFHTLLTHAVDEVSEEKHLNNGLLPPEISQIFTLGNKPGAVYIQYSQTGKTLTEVLEDEDEVIDSSNITSHRVTNGSYSICLGGEDSSEERQNTLQERYNKLLQNINLEIDEREMVLGRPEIGFVVTDDIQKVVENMRLHPILHSITVNNKTKIVDSFCDRSF